ncbi:MAG: hypothetical protein ACYCWA_10685, partial [Thiobacillus sp.]
MDNFTDNLLSGQKMFMVQNKWIGTTRSALGFWDYPEALRLSRGRVLAQPLLSCRFLPGKTFP